MFKKIEMIALVSTLAAGCASVPSELREYTAARPNLIKFLTGSSALNLHC